MSDEYTPHDETVANSYARGRGVISIRALAEFDRWLAEHDRQVSEIAWDVGAVAEANAWFIAPENPFRLGAAE